MGDRMPLQSVSLQMITWKTGMITHASRLYNSINYLPETEDHTFEI